MESLSVKERKQVLANQGDQSKENDQPLEAMGSESLVMEKWKRVMTTSPEPSHRKSETKPSEKNAGWSNRPLVIWLAGFTVK
ncbi:MAG: hypothetical protein OXE77_03685 [Flavobacteriaceae bacterium]|nr:hypothetical protein [Flavobacteriaceae bacterium]MCY4266647.1 hypothetical protein [Flavobacteriaceae bacterium]